MSIPDQEMTLEDFFRTQQTTTPHRRLPLSLPLLLGLSTPATNRSDPGETRPIRERVIMINPLAQTMVVFESSHSLEGMLQDFLGKEGQSPATKAAIEGLPEVEVAEEGSECSICLGEYEIGGKAKEMPCRHRYHGGCIERWLGIHGNCPICRYEMPLEKKRDDGDDEVWVSFYVPDGDRSGSGSDSGSDPMDMVESDDQHSLDSNQGGDDDDGSSSVEDMEIDSN